MDKQVSGQSSRSGRGRFKFTTASEIKEGEESKYAAALTSPISTRMDRLPTRIARELFTDAFRGIQNHTQHFIRFGEHCNVTAL